MSTLPTTSTAVGSQKTIERPLKLDTNVFSAYVDKRNTELEVLWTRYNVGLALNMSILGALAISPGDSIVRKVGHSAVVVGLLLSIAWAISHLGGRQALKKRDAHLNGFEDRFEDEDVREFLRACRLDGHRHPQNGIAWLIIVGFMVVWTVWIPISLLVTG